MKTTFRLSAALFAGLLLFALPRCVSAADATNAPPRNEVVLVNVAAAVAPEVFQAAVAAIDSSIGFRVRGQELASLSLPQLTTNGRATVTAAVGPRACLAVFLVNDEQAPGILSQPGHWSLFNGRRLAFDDPAPQLYQERLVKLLLKGIGFAAGVGANGDPRCVLSHKSFTAAGIDTSSASYGPYAYYPLVDTLRALSDGAIFKESGGSEK